MRTQAHLPVLTAPELSNEERKGEGRRVGGGEGGEGEVQECGGGGGEGGRVHINLFIVNCNVFFHCRSKQWPMTRPCLII